MILVFWFLLASIISNLGDAWLLLVPSPSARQPRGHAARAAGGRQLHPVFGAGSSPPRTATAATAATTTQSCGSPLETLLREKDCPRLRTLHLQEQLPVAAEIFHRGQSVVGHITAIRSASRVQVRLPASAAGMVDDDGSTDVTVDFGQITTIWCDGGEDDDEDGVHDADAAAATYNNHNPAEVEAALDRLYRDRLSIRVGGGFLTKKRMGQIVNSWKLDDADEQQAAAAVLRKLGQAGGVESMHRLVDSQQLYYGSTEHPTAIQSRRHAAHCLSVDSALCGRFQRWPSVWVSATRAKSKSSSGSSTNTNNATSDSSNSQDYGEDDAELLLDTVTFVNGGWRVLDKSVRVLSEGRKFAERRTDASPSSNSRLTTTVADQRILRRLECLAMGEMLVSPSSSSSPRSRGDDDHSKSKDLLELDVREALAALQLPANPQGAREALVRVGHWSGDATQQRHLEKVLEPWSPPVLAAARWYAEETAAVNNNNGAGSLVSSNNQDLRLDLTHLPTVSVDAARTAFRDDALGIRPRAATGRRVHPEASKWEILVHIADVSDLYVAKDDGDLIQDHLSTLAAAAERRGESRYDLPLGPLHLLPPVALRAMSFPDNNSVPHHHRCVTIWAYIDERSGKLLDAGIERTLVAAPTKLSFAEATALMDGKGSAAALDAHKKARAMLLVVERNLKLWSDERRRNSEAARKRESRMAAREAQGGARRRLSGNKPSGDDGRDGFRRTRGHRLVDAALDLYAYASTGLLRKVNAPIPRTPGAGRVATAPLRRYIDGQAQRQLLAVLCDYGQPMSLAECKEVFKVASDARNAITNIRARRKA